MPAPAKAELQHALTELRLAAEAMKTYDANTADRLNAAILRHGDTVRAANGLAGEIAANHQRLIGHMEAVVDCVQRTKQYPTQILGRADLLDRASGMSKMARLLLDKLAPPPQR